MSRQSFTTLFFFKVSLFWLHYSHYSVLTLTQRLTRCSHSSYSPLLRWMFAFYLLEYLHVVTLSTSVTLIYRTAVAITFFADLGFTFSKRAPIWGICIMSFHFHNSIPSPPIFRNVLTDELTCIRFRQGPLFNWWYLVSLSYLHPFGSILVYLHGGISHIT